VYWICADNSVDHTQMFLVTAEQCLHRVKASSAPHSSPPGSRLGGNKKLGGDIAGTSVPS